MSDKYPLLRQIQVHHHVKNNRYKTESSHYRSLFMLICVHVFLITEGQQNGTSNVYT